MLISRTSTALLRRRMNSSKETFCSGLFLSARWFIVSQTAEKGTHLIVLPTREAAEYCSADLYNLVEGDNVFFLPDSGGAVERSNYKSSLGVQRTAAIGKMMDSGEGPLFIVTYPAALEELVPQQDEIEGALLTISVGQEITYDDSAADGVLSRGRYEINPLEPLLNQDFPKIVIGYLLADADGQERTCYLVLVRHRFF